MVYEAMLAGLNSMIPFWGGFKANVLKSGTGKESMTRLYKPLEYACPLIKWEVHSEDHPPLLTDEAYKAYEGLNEGKPPPHYFSRLVISLSLVPTHLNKLLRAPHRKRPRQIYDYQELHSSVCLHPKNLPKNPFARLPDSWANNSGNLKQYGWTEVIDMLRDKEDDMKESESESD